MPTMAAFYSSESNPRSSREALLQVEKDLSEPALCLTAHCLADGELDREAFRTGSRFNNTGHGLRDLDLSFCGVATGLARLLHHGFGRRSLEMEFRYEQSERC